MEVGFSFVVDGGGGKVGSKEWEGRKVRREEDGLRAFLGILKEWGGDCWKTLFFSLDVLI